MQIKQSTVSLMLLAGIGLSVSAFGADNGAPSLEGGFQTAENDTTGAHKPSGKRPADAQSATQKDEGQLPPCEPALSKSLKNGPDSLQELLESRRLNLQPVNVNCRQEGVPTSAQGAVKWWTPLTSASFECQPKVVDSLLRYGAVAQIDQTNSEGDTALIAAAISNQPCPAVMKLLIDEGVDVDRTDQRQRTALSIVKFLRSAAKTEKNWSVENDYADLERYLTTAAKNQKTLSGSNR